jgi:hypothetical protein
MARSIGGWVAFLAFTELGAENQFELSPLQFTFALEP